MSSSPAFELAGVQVNLGGRPVLDSLDLRFVAGDMVALIGPSGAGKTTLLRVLNGVIAPSRGHLKMFGQNPADLAEARRRHLRADVGFVHQDHSLVPNLRVLQNVVAGGLGHRGFWSSLRLMIRPVRADLMRAHQLLERVGIGDRMYHRTDSLSGGQQQRVALARALFQSPHALLADEPVSAVDPARARDMIALLTTLAKEEGWTLIASLHDVALAREFFPRLVALREGKVAFDGPPQDLTESAAEAIYRLDG